MDIDMIKALFSMYSGEENVLPWLPLILMSVHEVEGLLKKDADKRDPRISALGAAHANVRYVQSTAARDKLSHTHAGTAAKNGNGAEKLDFACKLYSQIRDGCAELLADREFSFASVGKDG